MNDVSDQDINAQRAEIAAGISLAEARRNAREHRVNPAAFDASKLRDGSIPLSPARNVLTDRFGEAVGKWARVPQTMMSGQPAHLFALPRTQAALELLDDALDKLAATGKKGERVDALRESLESERARLATALEAYEGFRADFTGPTAQSLIAKIIEVRDAAANAEAAYATATRETLDAAMLAKEHVRIADRDLGVEMDRALRTLQVPYSLPSAEDFERPRLATEALEALPSKNPTCRQIAAAIEQGLNHGGDALYWVMFETKPDHALVQWRAKAAAEARG